MPTTISESPTISPEATVHSCRLGRFTEVAAQVNMQECTLDDYSYVMERCELIYADIGKFVNIASDVRINPGNHPMDWVSQHHFLYRMKQYGFKDHDDDEYFSWRRQQSVVIGHDVWIGHKATVMPGITVGNGAVVGAGSIVTHNVPPYAIVAGAPARKLRNRFPEKIWRAIEKTRWWNWNHQTIRERIDDFRDIRRFLARYGEDSCE